MCRRLSFVLTLALGVGLAAVGIVLFIGVPIRLIQDQLDWRELGALAWGLFCFAFLAALCIGLALSGGWQDDG